MTKKLTPTIRQFKAFLQSNPHIIKAIRSNKISLQECYEQYVLLGENDQVWEKYHTNNEKKDSVKDGQNDEKMFSKWLNKISQLDLNHVEKHIHDLNGAIDQVMKVIDQYKHFTNDSSEPSPRPVRDPFSFRMRD
ncbi:spore coat protein YlbD [Gracilibacillus xinjiangensis]|uniref:Spore coat protein YlbD n=1 Tax=Gracilibacillus xinjiangensis TaxID=1193282 RepID=A0ABV8WYX1_9BACI